MELSIGYFMDCAPQLNVEVEKIQQKITLRFKRIFQLGFEENILRNANPKPHLTVALQAFISGMLYQFAEYDNESAQNDLLNSIYDYIIIMVNHS